MGLGNRSLTSFLDDFGVVGVEDPLNKTHDSLFRVFSCAMPTHRALIRWGPKRRGKTLIFKVKQDFEKPDWLEAWARVARIEIHFLHGGFSGCSVEVGRE